MAQAAKPEGESDLEPFWVYPTALSSQQVVMACDTDAKYALTIPESGAMMADGTPYPEGTMMMHPVQ